MPTLALGSLLALSACCIVAVTEEPTTGGTSGATSSTASSTGSTSGAASSSGSGTSTGTTSSSSSSSSTTSGSTSGGAACTPFDSSLCGQGQYCEYKLAPCVDDLDNLPTPGTCTNLCSQDPEGMPICGGGCASDVDCSLTEACTDSDTPGCQPVVCQDQPSMCPSECQMISVPHGCPTCVCQTCPAPDGGVTLPDGGECPSEDVCLNECCGPGTYCCAGTILDICVPLGDECPE